MSWIKPPMPFLSRFSLKMSKKKLDTHMSQIKHPMSVWYGFSMKMPKKSSIPKCHKLSIPCQSYMVFSIKKRPKKLDTQMSGIQHLMSFLSDFSIGFQQLRFTPHLWFTPCTTMTRNMIHSRKKSHHSSINMFTIG